MSDLTSWADQLGSSVSIAGVLCAMLYNSSIRKHSGAYFTASTACCRCACGERRVRPTTSIGTDTETDKAEVKRQDSRICICGAGPVEHQAAAPAVFSEPPVVRTRAQEKQRAVIEPLVARAKSRDSTRAAFHKVAKACSPPHKPELTRCCNKDRLLTWTIGVGLMVGSLLIALLLLVVVVYGGDRNAASAVTAAQPKKIAPTIESNWQPPLRKAHAQAHPSANTGMKPKDFGWDEENRTDSDRSPFSTTGERV
ncbi:uncharacterized protein [Dermacentor albipictus]|uniref:uncharacterized protein n=1 Tax=Dermacentor albipictus TaxID=60249 RepID=UPI0038FD382F